MEALKYTGIGAVVGVAIRILASIILCILGFRSQGVRKGSRASLMHSEIGSARSGSLFSSAQSHGAKGALRSILIFGIVGALFGLGIFIVKNLS